MSDWQPIETAPTYEGDDPPRVLLWVADGGLLHDGGISFGCVYRYTDRRIKFRPVAEGYHGPWEITHWMPLPEPPK